MADLNVNPNPPVPDGDDEADRAEKKRQVDAQQRATADQRAAAFKQTMKQGADLANPYAVQQQSKETGKPAQPDAKQVAPLAQPGAKEGEAQIKSPPGQNQQSAATGDKAINTTLSQTGSQSSQGQPMARMSSPSGESAGPSANTPTGGAAGSAGSGGSAGPAASGKAASSEQSAVQNQSAGAGGNDAGSGESGGDDGGKAGNDLTSRIDIASITPSFPTPTTQGHTPLAATPPPAGVNMQMIEQMIQFAAVGKTKEGLSEFHLGIGAGPLAGLNICLTACGKRRVKLRFSGVVDTDAITDAQVNQLVGALQSRDVEVVEVEIA